MPFTISHAAFAYPLKYIHKKSLSVTGLVLGAMSPDFEYFIYMEPYRSIGHTWQGFFLQALPLSFLLAFLFHIIIKQSLALHLPSVFHLQERAFAMSSSSNRKWNLSQLFIFLFSCFIGFVTHIMLDASTHQNGYIVQLFGYSNVTILNLPLYKFLQYSLSIAGLVIIGAHLLIRIMRQPVIKKAKVRVGISFVQYWLIAFFVMILIVAFKFMLTSSTNQLGIIIVAPITALFVGITVSSVIDLLVQKKRKKSYYP